MSRTQLDEAIEPVEAFTITEFKEQAREVMDTVAEHRAVAIVRHRTAEAVLIPVEDYVELVKLRRERLDFLTRRYDDLVALMQTPQAAAGVDALFNATSEELGRAAVATARRG